MIVQLNYKKCMLYHNITSDLINVPFYSKTKKSTIFVTKVLLANQIYYTRSSGLTGGLWPPVGLQCPNLERKIKKI